MIFHQSEELIKKWYNKEGSQSRKEEYIAEHFNDAFNAWLNMTQDNNKLSFTLSLVKALKILSYALNAPKIEQDKYDVLQKYIKNYNEHLKTVIDLSIGVKEKILNIIIYGAYSKDIALHIAKSITLDQKIGKLSYSGLDSILDMKPDLNPNIFNELIDVMTRSLIKSNNIKDIDHTKLLIRILNSYDPKERISILKDIISKSDVNFIKELDLELLINIYPKAIDDIFISLKTPAGYKKILENSNIFQSTHLDILFNFINHHKSIKPLELYEYAEYNIDIKYVPKEPSHINNALVLIQATNVNDKIRQYSHNYLKSIDTFLCLNEIKNKSIRIIDVLELRNNVDYIELIDLILNDSKLKKEILSDIINSFENKSNEKLDWNSDSWGLPLLYIYIMEYKKRNWMIEWIDEPSKNKLLNDIIGILYPEKNINEDWIQIEDTFSSLDIPFRKIIQNIIYESKLQINNYNFTDSP